MRRWQRGWRRNSIRFIEWTIGAAVLFSLSKGQASSEEVRICIDGSPRARERAALSVTEIEEMGFSVSVREACVFEPTPSTVREMSERGIQAIIVLKDPCRLVDIWAEDRQGEQLVHRTVEIEAGEWEDASLTALRASELLRAMFVELKTAPRERSEKGPPRPTAAQSHGKETGVRDPTPTPTVLSEFDAAVSSLSFAHPPTARLIIGALCFLSPILGIEISAFMPLSAERFSVDQGTVILTDTALGIGLTLSYMRPSSRFGLKGGAGARLGILVVHGRAHEGFEGSREAVLGALPYGRLSISVRLSKRVSWRIGAEVSLYLPRTHILAAKREIFTPSWVGFTGFTGVEVSFFKKR